ncbi:MAG: GbsR/MarR family transcriptional regulator [Paracoccaceae bacterium]
MKLTPATQAFVLHWGEMGAKWGTNRSVAQVHALLHVSPDPLTADQICDSLGLARSNVSTALKELQAWKLVKISRQLGDRRDYFTSVRDMFDLVTVIVEQRRAREFAPTVEALRAVTEDAGTDGTPDTVRARMSQTLETMELFDGWYRDVSRMPRSVQMAALRLGARIARLLPGGSD